MAVKIVFVCAQAQFLRQICNCKQYCTNLQNIHHIFKGWSDGV